MMKQMLKNKKGVAIEMSIFLLLIVFAFCTGIISITYLEFEINKLKIDNLNERIYYDQIAEDFLSYIKSSENENKEEGFTVTNITEIELGHNEEKTLFTLRLLEGENTTFEVNIEYNGTDYQLINNCKYK